MVLSIRPDPAYELPVPRDNKESVYGDMIDVEKSR